MLVRHAQLFFGAEHGVRHDAAHGFSFEFDLDATFDVAVVEDGAFFCVDCTYRRADGAEALPLLDVRCTGDHGVEHAGGVFDLGEDQAVGVGMLGDFSDVADDDEIAVPGEFRAFDAVAFDAVDFETRAGQSFGEFVDGQGDVDVVTQPRERNTHVQSFRTYSRKRRVTDVEGQKYTVAGEFERVIALLGTQRGVGVDESDLDHVEVFAQIGRDDDAVPCQQPIAGGPRAGGHAGEQWLDESRVLALVDVTDHQKDLPVVHRAVIDLPTQGQIDRVARGEACRCIEIKQRDTACTAWRRKHRVAREWQRLGRRRRVLAEVRPWDGVLVGVAQALAVIPGVSRSGSTLTASLFDGWRRSEAARFSFLLGIPAITLAGLVEFKNALDQPMAGGVGPLLVGILSALVVSWLAIAWLLRFLQNHSTWWFVGYRLLFGASILLWLGRTAAG